MISMNTLSMSQRVMIKPYRKGYAMQRKVEGCMKIILNDLYLSQSDVIKEKIKKGEHVEISFANVSALGVSIVQDLKDLIFLPNVRLVDVADFVKRQLVDQLGIEFDADLHQMSLF